MNNINRHNYETFFLLYTDNELSVDEKKEVEEFAAANPDLQEELVMLQQSVLKPDTILFGDKNSLFRDELAASELQERLLLYLDKELAPLEMNETDALISSNTDIKKEWDILQQTKLSGGDLIVFKDKQSLYRKEPGRIIAFPWKRIAAAAVLIGFGLWGGFVYLNKTAKPADVVTNNSNVQENLKQSSGAAKATTGQNQAIVAPQEIREEPAVQQLVKTTPKAKNNLVEKTAKLPKKIQPGKEPKDDVHPDEVAQKDNNLPKPYFDNVNKIDGNKGVPSPVVIQRQPSNIVNPGNDETIRKRSTDNNSTNEFATTASYVDNSEDNSNNRVLFMDEEKIKKTKLGGIFRKVKRVFERNTNMKSGSNNIKVANLEFAIQ